MAGLGSPFLVPFHYGLQKKTYVHYKGSGSPKRTRDETILALDLYLRLGHAQGQSGNEGYIDLCSLQSRANASQPKTVADLIEQAAAKAGSQ